MNCKQGDLALVVTGPSTGMMVTCLEALPAGWQRDDLPRGYRQPISLDAGPLWRVDRLIEWSETPESRKYGLRTSMCVVPDTALVPIRPDRTEDDAATIDVAEFDASAASLSSGN